jgi:hypothetical protein
MSSVSLEWITRVETPCQVVIYVSREKRQLFLAGARLDDGGEPLAAVDLTNPVSGELKELVEMTKWFLSENVDTGDQSFVPVFDFGHEMSEAIFEGRHPMVGVALIGGQDCLLTAEDFAAGRTTAFDAGGAELLPITVDLGPLIGDLERSHVVLVLTAAEG